MRVLQVIGSLGYAGVENVVMNSTEVPALNITGFCSYLNLTESDEHWADFILKRFSQAKVIPGRLLKTWNIKKPQRHCRITTKKVEAWR